MRISIFNRNTKQQEASEAERKATKEVANVARNILDAQFDSLFGLMNETLNSIKAEQEETKQLEDKGTGNE